LFASCRRANTTEDPQSQLQALLDMAHERRQNIYPPSSERLHQLTYERTPRTTSLISAFYELPSRRAVRPAQYVIDDIQLYFEILREAYGGYTFFGGDSAFLPIFDEILEQLATQDTWNIRYVITLIYNRLQPYIHDSHLRFSRSNFASSYGVFSANIFFDKVNNVFIDRNNGLILKEIVGYEIDDILRLTVDQYGELFYTPVIIGHYDDLEDKLLIINYENGDSTTIELSATSAAERSPYRNPSLDFIDDIPVITINQMYFTALWDVHEENAQLFLSFIDELRNEPAIIVDLRGNEGGSNLLAARWFYLFTGEFIPKNSVGLTVETEELFTWRLQTPSPDFISYPPLPNEISERQIHIPLGDNHFVTYPIDPNEHNIMFANDQLLIILTDRYTASAAEKFVDMSFNIENTLVVGQNTAGAMLTNLCFPWLVLPNTGIEFGLGSQIFIHADAHNFQEGVGLAPDLWIPCGDDALLAALALLRSHFDS